MPGVTQLDRPDGTPLLAGGKEKRMPAGLSRVTQDVQNLVLMSTTQATLLERLRNGSAVLAWEEFFQRYGRAIYALARSRGCSAQTAEDVVQEVLLAIFEQHEVFEYDPSCGRFRDWLAAVVRNVVATRRRRPSQRVRGEGGDSEMESEPEAAEASPEAGLEAAFERAMLAVLLAVVRQEVTPETYQAFELSVLHELPAREVAEITGLSRNAVYLARRRVLRRLRDLGAPYREDGQLGERVKEAWASLPDDLAHAAISARIERTMHSRVEVPQ
jgi:RNA polymerase sigma-70 factor (ECF subfamily)